MGDLVKEGLKTINDMNLREKIIFTPLIIMTILLGIYPSLALDIIGPTVNALIENYEIAISESRIPISSSDKY